MIPGRAKILACPHCGGKKEILNLLSGNTCGRVLWSDLKTILPMLPQASYVQKCPHCGRYYITSRQRTEEMGSEFCLETGELSYPEMKEAWEELSVLEDLTLDERRSMLIMLVWTFNDMYTRNEADDPSDEENKEKQDETKKEIPAEEKEYMESVVKQLLTQDVDDLFRAELLREIGAFDEAQKYLDSIEIDNDFLRGVQEKIREKIEAHDALPFII